MTTKTELQKTLEQLTVVYTKYGEGTRKYDRWEPAGYFIFCEDQEGVLEAFMSDVDPAYGQSAAAGDFYNWCDAGSWDAETPAPEWYDKPGIYHVDGEHVWSPGDNSACYGDFTTYATDGWDFYKNIASGSQKIRIAENLDCLACA